MKTFLASILLVLTASCGILGTSTGLSQQNVAPAATIVCNRHDSYVNSDAGLNVQSAQEFLSQSAAVRGLLANDPIPVAPLRAALTPVLDRYDAYVQADASLTAPQQVTRLRSSELLRSLIE